MVAGIGAVGRFIRQADDLIDAIDKPAKDILRWANRSDFNPVEMPRNPTFGLKSLKPPRQIREDSRGFFYWNEGETDFPLQPGDLEEDWDKHARFADEWFEQTFVSPDSYRDPLDNSPVLNFAMTQDVTLPEDYDNIAGVPHARKMPDLGISFDQEFEYIKDFEDLPAISPWARTIGDYVRDTGESLTTIQQAIVRGDRKVDTPIDALGHWQHVGNNNVQSILRTGKVNLPAFGDNVLELYQRGYDYDEIENIFATSANMTIGWLDDLIDSSRMHPSVSIYRGIPDEAMANVFGRQFLRDMFDIQDSIFKNNPDIGALSRGVPMDSSTVYRPKYDDVGRAALNRINSYVGREFVDFAYTAGSLNPRIAASFVDSVGGGYLLQIDVPKRTGLLSVSGNLRDARPAYRGEHEMILGRNSRFQVVSIVPTYRSLYNDIEVEGLARTPINSIEAIIKLRVV